MTFLSELFSTTIYETSSPFSGLIKVIDVRGERRLTVGDFIQSVMPGKPLNHRFWGRLSAYPLPRRKDLAVLVLGLGGGTVAHLLSRSLKPKRIVGVEIDATIVEIAKKYFDLDKIKTLKVVIGDARTFVRDNLEKFDYIIVDTYKGGVFPRVLEGKSFLKGLKDNLSDRGVIVFNRIYPSSRPERRLRFQRLLEEIFGPVKEEVVEGPSDAKNYIYWVAPNFPIPASII